MANRVPVKRCPGPGLLAVVVLAAGCSGSTRPTAAAPIPHPVFHHVSRLGTYWMTIDPSRGIAYGLGRYSIVSLDGRNRTRRVFSPPRNEGYCKLSLDPSIDRLVASGVRVDHPATNRNSVKGLRLTVLARVIDLRTRRTLATIPVSHDRIGCNFGGTPIDAVDPSVHHAFVVDA